MIKQYLLSIFMALVSSLTQAGDLPTTRDWADVAEAAKQGHVPILAVFESEDCGYCERLRKDILAPLPDTCSLQPPLIKEFDIDSGGKLTDFNGDSIRSRQFKERYNIYAVPTLVFLAPDGTPLTDPIVGYNLKQDEYRDLLRASLMDSYRALH
ncbi:MAG: thioredoxin fold domain-containing protein [Candidatus Thiodiazotropha sp.]